MSRIARVAIPAVLGGKSYEQKLKALFGSALIGLWAMDELSDSICYDDATPVENITNGGFETAGAGGADVFGTWVETAGDGAIADETTIAHGGGHAAKLTAGASVNTKLSTPTILTRPSTVLTLTFYTRGDGTYAGRYLVYDVTNSANIISTTSTGVTGTTYTQVSVTINVPSNCTSMRIDLFCPGTNTGVAYFDGVSMLVPCYGSYTGSISLANAAGPKGKLAPLFDGSTTYNNLKTTSFQNAFSGSAGAVLLWGKVVSSGVWTDATTRNLVYFYYNSSNYVYVRRSSTNNRLTCGYNAGGAGEVAKNIDSLSTTAWFQVGWNWSQGAIQAYYNGLPSGTAGSTAGTWAGAPGTMLIGASATTPTAVWSGWIQYVVLLNRVMTDAEVARAYAM